MKRGASPIVRLDDVTFADAVRSTQGLLLVSFWAPWCASCHVMAPILNALAGERRVGLVVATVNVDDCMATAEALGIRSLPSVALFLGGRELCRYAGVLPQPLLDALLYAVGDAP